MGKQHFWVFMKIAIVGSGISGMTCGHYLAENQHDVHLFEADTRIGGHTHTHDVEVESGTYKVDTGFIVHNTRNYPLFLKLMQKIGVKTQDSIMSFSVKSESPELEYNGTTINALFAQRRNLVRPSFYRMIKDIIRFNKEATSYYQRVKDAIFEEKTLEEFLRTNRYSMEFTEHYIMPMGAAIWSASRQEMRHFPLNYFIRFFHHHGLLQVNDRPQWRTMVNGSSSYIPNLTANYADKIHLNSPVQSVRRKHKQVEVVTGGRTFEFDQVIFATHADQTVKILETPTPDETRILKGFAYRPNDIVLHTDTSVLPKRRLAHASWNYYLPKNLRERVAVTYHMNMLQGIRSPESFLVSLNMDDYIDPKKIITSIPYSHPVYDINSVASQNQWSSISGADRIHFCGAYWGNGFHEDGVRSAIKVIEKLGIAV
jgi:predicted NAD/FAD-binding protein